MFRPRRSIEQPHGRFEMRQIGAMLIGLSLRRSIASVTSNRLSRKVEIISVAVMAFPCSINDEREHSGSRTPQ